ncbi:MAG: NAD(+)--dinitrogen-reductase ADP-D-ribosyltransferase [Stellaceae bacterium]
MSQESAAKRGRPAAPPAGAGEDVKRLHEWGHTVNLVGVSPRLLGGAEFNDRPVALHIGGVREMFASLFEMLAQAERSEEAAQAVDAYMAAVFGLDREQRPSVTSRGRRFLSSYVRLLRGWGYDSNSREGAVLKGWVESRFGLFPTFHRERLGRFASPAWMTYVEEKMGSRFHNNSILVQLDLLYEFCQWSLARFFLVGRSHLTLYRGVNKFDEQILIERADRRPALVRLNNLASFTSDRNIAGEFGDIVLEAQIPAVKILFFAKLMARHALQGEAEYLVLGGDYRVLYRDP